MLGHYRWWYQGNGMTASTTRAGCSGLQRKAVGIMSTVKSTERATSTAWVQFPAVVILISGIFSGTQGIVALIGPNVYYTVVNGSLFLFDVTGWGWWNLILGILLILTSIALFSGARWARIVAIVLAIISSVVQLLLVPVQPWWSFIVIAIDMLIIYALVAHKDEFRTEG